MVEITKTELEEAQKALSRKQPPCTPQLTLLSRRLAAFRLALSLITRELEGLGEQKEAVDKHL